VATTKERLMAHPWRNGARGVGARTVVAVGVLVLAGALSSCGEDADPAEAGAEYCASIEALRTEVARFAEEVAADATVDELRAQREAITAAYDGVEEAAEGRDEAVADAVEEAQEQFADSVGEIEGDTVAGDAVGIYEEASTTYETQLQEIAADAAC
jgi:hypothetical protein